MNPKYICITCGCIKPSGNKIGECAACRTATMQAKFEAQYMSRLDELGFDFIGYVGGLSHLVGNKRQALVKRRDCGHVFDSQLNNLFSKGGKYCGVCGPKRRMAKCMEGYINKYGRDYDLAEWEDYRFIVRELSNEAYNANIALLNPEGLRRGRPDLDPNCAQLDHIVPIITGFKNKIPPEVMADIKNLRIIPAVHNLSKKQKLTEEAKILLAEMLAVL